MMRAAPRRIGHSFLTYERLEPGQWYSKCSCGWKSHEQGSAEFAYRAYREHLSRVDARATVALRSPMEIRA